jgi:hypothetical protein
MAGNMRWEDGEGHGGVLCRGATVLFFGASCKSPSTALGMNGGGKSGG